jgi:hypothetical protein
MFLAKRKPPLPSQQSVTCKQFKPAKNLTPIVHSLEDSSRVPQCLCRAVCADTPIRRHADTVVIFGCGSAALYLCAFA